MIIVMTTLRPTSNMVNSRYFPSSGNASEVDGIISDMSRKNMVCDSRMLMHRAINLLSSALNVHNLLKPFSSYRKIRTGALWPWSWIAYSSGSL